MVTTTVKSGIELERSIQIKLYTVTGIIFAIFTILLYDHFVISASFSGAALNTGRVFLWRLIRFTRI